MKPIKKIAAAAVAAVMLTAAAGCGASFPVNDYLDEKDGYDKTLFYQNTGVVQAADPSVITVGDTFYLYATNAFSDGDCSYICGWSSKNLSDWQSLGAVFVPARDAWAVDSLWAPEVVAKDGKYYMYYSGYCTAKGRLGLGLAVSESPAGPFHEIEGTFGGTEYSRTQMPFDFGFPAIDASPFIDDDGAIYLYFSKDQVNSESSVYGCALEADMVTVIPDSLTAEPLVRAVQDWEGAQSSARWNEAPFVIKHDGKYLLMYSANYYQSTEYSMGVAVSDSPLSGFTKPDYNPVLNADADWTFVSGTGHNSIFSSPDGEELWIAYHSHIDTENGGSERKINFDRVTFDDEGRMIVCGPSVTPQLLPSGSSEYKNIAGRAEVATSGAQEGVELLTDGIINWKYADAETYEYALSGKTKITFTFASAVALKAIMVYDSVDFARSADKVTVGLDGEAFELKFNPAYRYTDEYDFDVKIPGSAAIAEFAERSVKTVTLEFDGNISLGEIVLVGK